MAGKSAVPSELMQELAGAYLWRVGDSKLQLHGVDVVVGKRVGSVQGAEPSNVRTSWESLPPHDKAKGRQLVVVCSRGPVRAELLA